MASYFDHSGYVVRPEDKNKKEEIDSEYFTLPHPVLTFFGAFGLYQMVAAAFSPKIFPGFLGLSTTIVRYFGNKHPRLSKFFLIASIVSHVFEAKLAKRYCRTLNLSEAATVKWMVSTFILGYPSLRLIKAAAQKK